MCPGGQFGNQFGSTCYFDERIDGVVCNCQEGYVGKRNSFDSKSLKFFWANKKYFGRKKRFKMRKVCN